MFCNWFRRPAKGRSRPVRRQVRRTNAVQPRLEGFEDRTLPSTTALLVQDIRPGFFGSNPTNLTDFNGTLYFAASDGVHGNELWKSNGTAASTLQVKDINSGPGDSNPANLTVVGTTMFFTADDGATGVELWKTNGTAGGTVLVKDINPGPASANPANLIAFQGQLFFTASDGVNGVQLWRSDGTTGGTFLVKDINTSAPGASSAPTLLTVVGNALFFRANDGIHGFQLWESDGTAAGTQIVTSINPAGNAGITSLQAFNGKLYFAANDGTNGTQLWTSDGTPAGTHMVADINTTASGASSNPANLTVSNNKLFFSATDGVNGIELWVTNGTAAGTRIVKDVNPGPSDSNPAALTDVDGTLFFRATDATDGTELWKSDGTAAGTVLVKDINPGSASSSPANLINLNGKLFFQANDTIHGVELWRSDGTAAGTTLIRDMRSGSAGSNPSFLTISRGTLYFAANDGVSGPELWRVVNDFLVTGSGYGSAPVVNIFDSVTGQLIKSFNAYDPRFRGGVHVAVGDVNGDGIPDVITAPGYTGGPDIRIFDGATGRQIDEFLAYAPGFLGGVNVAVADINGDGLGDIITTPGPTGGPQVTVFSGANNEVLASFMAYTPTFTGGVNVAVGDVNGDGVPDIVTAPMGGMAPEVRVFDGANLAGAGPTADISRDFMAFESVFAGGVSIAVGDINGDGKADIITGAGAGGGPRVTVFSGADPTASTRLQDFMAYNPIFAGGVSVSVVADVNGDGGAEIVTGAGAGGGPHLQVFDGTTLQVLDSFFAYDPSMTAGIYVAASHK
jgi:ELWxxDGT repeat protein